MPDLTNSIRYHWAIMKKALLLKVKILWEFPHAVVLGTDLKRSSEIETLEWNDKTTFSWPHFRWLEGTCSSFCINQTLFISVLKSKVLSHPGQVVLQTQSPFSHRLQPLQTSCATPWPAELCCSSTNRSETIKEEMRECQHLEETKSLEEPSTALVTWSQGIYRVIYLALFNVCRWTSRHAHAGGADPASKHSKQAWRQMDGWCFSHHSEGATKAPFVSPFAWSQHVSLMTGEMCIFHIFPVLKCC